MKYSSKSRHLHFRKCLFIIRVLTWKCGGRKGSMADEFNPAYGKLLKMKRNWPLQTRACTRLDSKAPGILQLLDCINRMEPERTVSPECRAQIVARLPFSALLLCPCRTDTNVLDTWGDKHLSGATCLCCAHYFLSDSGHNCISRNSPCTH